MTGSRARTLLAALVALTAFAIYRATLLPGVDFGDTGSFQATVGSAIVSPRDGYPLYFAIANLFLRLHPTDPAHALNLLSAVEGGIACGLLVLAGAELSGSALAGAAAALLFAGSYTFWSQAVIAEVYALHAIFVALTTWLALRWSVRPTFRRLLLLLVVYALGFGNHLSMILLAPGLTVFLLLAAPGGWRSMLSPRVMTLAVLCAVGGSLQYLWNLRTLWLLPFPPASIAEALQRFWFDVTKVDWRATMVLQVPRVMVSDHLAMYAFDLHQQFGWIGPVFALLGLAFLVRASWRAAIFLFLLWIVNAAFAFGYNVGDTHVFYLPSHLIVALLVAPGIVAAGRLIDEPRVMALVMAGYAAVRIYGDYPALDRSGDERPTRVLQALTAELDDRRDVLLLDVNWQVQNGLAYFTKAIHPQIATALMNDVVLYLPRLAADNQAIGRDVVLTASARSTAAAAYGPLLPLDADRRAPAPSLADTVRSVPRGTRYVLAMLKPTGGNALDWADLGAALASAGDGRPAQLPDGDYIVIAGIIGRPPAMVRGANRPFRDTFDLGGLAVDVRMESWLAADTIRRMGFGHAIVNRHHTLILERGVSFAAFDDHGVPTVTAYAAGIFAPERRYLIRSGAN